MELICQNCELEITQNFCGNCGQKKYKRIDKKYIWDEIQYTVLHTNKGFLYSVKNILKNPGKTAREFIEGNRVNHYKPILLAFVLSGISTFISFKIINFKEIMKELYAQQNLSTEFAEQYTTFTSSYNSIIMLLCIPIFAFITKLCFRKWGHNYYEHIVMNSFILSFYTLFNILLFYPLIYLFKDNSTFVSQIIILAFAPLPFILFWFFKGFYKEKSTKNIVIRVLATLIFTLILFVLLIILISVIYFLLNPEIIQQLKQTKRV